MELPGGVKVSRMIERITKIETTLEDNNQVIHRVEEAIFGNGKPGLLSDFRLLAESVERHHKEADARIKAEAARNRERKTDWKWIVTTIVAIAAVAAAIIK